MSKKSIVLCVIAFVLCAICASAGQPKKVSMEEVFNTIMTKAPGKWNDSARVALCHFVENIKIAYETKDSDYLANTFKFKEYIPRKYKIEERNRYIHQLKECFKSKYKVKVSIYDYDVSKLSYGGELFGINLYYGYKCKKIKDKGYLFVLLDVNNPQDPIVKVWVWQKDRDPQVNSHLEKTARFYGLFSGSNF